MTGKVIVWSGSADIKKIEAEIQKVHDRGPWSYILGTPPTNSVSRRSRTFSSGMLGSSWRTHRPQLWSDGCNERDLLRQRLRLGDSDAVEDRCHRIGQSNRVTYVDLITPGSIDQRIVRALRDKITCRRRLWVKKLGNG